MSSSPAPPRIPSWLLVFGVALVVRVLVALPGLDSVEQTFFRNDTVDYIGPARSLAEEGRYLDEPGSDLVEVVRAPGFPALLAVLLRLGLGLTGIVLVFCVLGSVTPVLVQATARRLGDDRAGRIAGLLFALNLTAIALTPLFLSDMLYGLLVSLELLLAVGVVFGTRLRDVALLALVAGLAALVRPMGLPWFAYLLLLVALRPVSGLRPRIVGLTVAVLVFGATVVPWMARNQAAGGGFRLDTTAATHLLDYVCPVILARENGTRVEDEQDAIRAEWEAVFAADPAAYDTEGKRFDWKMKRALGIFRDHPLGLAGVLVEPEIVIPEVNVLLEDLEVTRGGKGTTAILHTRGPVAAARHYLGDRMWLLAIVSPLLLLVALTYAAAFLRLLQWIARREGRLLLLFLAFGIGPVVGVPLPVARYMHPVFPILCVMTGLLLADLRTHGRRALALRAPVS